MRRGGEFQKDAVFAQNEAFALREGEILLAQRIGRQTRAMLVSPTLQPTKCYVCPFILRSRYRTLRA